MIIHVFVDVYPHPFKPYLDAQFEDWHREGHQVIINSQSSIPGALSPVSVCTIKTLRDAPLMVCVKIALAFLHSPRRMATVFSKASGLLAKLKLMAIDCQLPRRLPDLIFVHNLAAGVRFGYLKHLFPKIPFALYYHGGEIPGVPSIPADQAKHALASPDVVFTNTNYSVGDAVRRGAQRSKVIRIPVGFRLEDYRMEIDRGYRKNGRFQIVSVGRVAIEKGFDIAMSALAELRKSVDIDFEYTLVGDGPEMQNIRQLAQSSGIGNHVRFMGRLNNADVISVLSSADILVLPSIPANTCEETQACVMQEAMLMGAVVIASDIGGISESIPGEMHKYLFEAGDYLQLAHNIESLISSGVENIRKLGCIGHDFVTSKYDAHIINKRLLYYSERSVSGNLQGLESEHN